MEHMNRPSPLRTDLSNAFAHVSMQSRVPRILNEVQQLNADYDPLIQQALDTLHDAIQDNAPIPMLDLPAPDYDDWAAQYAEHAGETWLGSSWFFAEIFFYRHLLQAVRWFETGRDPFASKKAEELAGAALWERLALALSTRGEPALQRLAESLKHALWGNRIDLSYAVAAAHGSAWEADDLLADDSLLTAERLLSLPGDVHLITDNAGTELATDLVLVDTLLACRPDRVFMHLKAYPTFVSDTTLPDLLHFLSLLDSGAHGVEEQALAARLMTALNAGRLRLAPDPYWNSTRFAWDSPRRLTDCFHNAALLIFKGDANYRRIVGDAVWAVDTPFASVVDYFGVPVLALRTLKSDPVVGLPPEMAARLDGIDKDWRINGRRGLIQSSFNKVIHD